jgi:hypothetical protein
MRTAAAQAAAWKAQGLGVRIAVNVSARQLQDMNVVDQFASILDSAGLKPSLVDVELTESSFIEDENAAHGLMKQFRQLGAQIHLDDFGTGYSSLSQLSRLPLDSIKLDRSFITGIDRNTRSQALVSSVVARAGAELLGGRRGRRDARGGRVPEADRRRPRAGFLLRAADAGPGLRGVARRNEKAQADRLSMSASRARRRDAAARFASVTPCAASTRAGSAASPGVPCRRGPSARS